MCPTQLFCENVINVLIKLMINTFFRLITGLYQICFASTVVSDHNNRHGGVIQLPSFVQEPPSHVIFSNNTGAQITCVAHGNPIPLVTWLTKDGSLVNSVPGLRFVLKFFLSLSSGEFIFLFDKSDWSLFLRAFLPFSCRLYKTFQLETKFPWWSQKVVLVFAFSM